ncbi:DUF669 domain-containing protein [Acetobacter sacchari]|uniref:DUF669 domain-containing protein n=1 Tax=Acetobacter sacchari TaxID=2661687 RepID=A0ABS3M163_9PROT|nr:DUF669 domain-containing protein [Acetobacter sacchari]MBO1361896.1 DUF669 domain-containing protein [Acetobacter sacchari]
MGNLSDCNYADAPDAPEFDLLPPGDYTGEIESAEMKDTKSRDGRYIKLKIQIDGSNRKLFHNLNVYNPSQQAQEIGRSQLKKIAETNGRVIDDSEDLVMCRVKMRVAVRPARGEYAAQNEIKSFMDLDGGSKGASVPRETRVAQANNGPVARAAASRPVQSSQAEKPWLKKRQETQNATADLDDEIPY